MTQPTISANLLLLADKWQAGADQVSLAAELADLGFSTIEIRREYFRDIAQEIPEVAKLAADKGLTLYYSIPAELFVAGQLNPELETFMAEAKAMGIQKAKFNIGDFANFNGDLVQTLQPLLSHGIEVNIENDQTQASGRLAPVQTFLEAVQAAKLNLGYVYDLGNWPFVREDPLEAAKALSPYVRYIHVKDDLTSGADPITVPLDLGDLPWRRILDVLPKTVPVALEYPTADTDVIKVGREKLADYFKESKDL
ncbi:MAG: sugar phosphate isomerase/epimerase [Lactobacillus sp.]|jgi:sugar phosphate isomerase/epimerase|nr:sugar phosphate isomerase/epimerase [Lactobacillus sp.]